MAKLSRAGKSRFITCVPKSLPDAMVVAIAEHAISDNPVNAPPREAVVLAASTAMIVDEEPLKLRLAVSTGKFWGSGGVKRTVGFLERVSTAFRDKLLLYANKWGQYGNIEYAYTANWQDADVRITLQQSGYWSYVGQDTRGIPRNQPTMCLQAFTVNTAESEWNRVVPHEFGHDLGCYHEQQLPEILELLDPQKTIAWGQSVLGWSEAQVRAQILTPIDPRTVMMTPHADVRGVMCYMLPASITRNGKPIPGGSGIDEVDGAFIAKVYPKAVQPPPPPPPAGQPEIILRFAAGSKLPDFECFVSRPDSVLAEVRVAKRG